MADPTRSTYDGLTEAYDFFNIRLFEGRLPRCLITMQRQKKAYGYFAGKRFGTKDGAEVTDEIALNPSHFRTRTTRESLSTLVHEMTHLEQHHFGKPSRNGYHNKEWGALMRRVGLIPSDTGQPGGKDTGQQMTHCIDAGGPFDLACAELEHKGFAVRYVELWTDPETRKKKAASKDEIHLPPLCGERMGEAGREPHLWRLRPNHAGRGRRRKASLGSYDTDGQARPGWAFCHIRILLHQHSVIP